MKYTVRLEQESDGGYVVSIPALPGCNSQGDSRDEALHNIREAAAVYVAHYRERGELPPLEVETDSIELDVGT